MTIVKIKKKVKIATPLMERVVEAVETARNRTLLDIPEQVWASTEFLNPPEIEIPLDEDPIIEEVVSKKIRNRSRNEAVKRFNKKLAKYLLTLQKAAKWSNQHPEE